MRKEIIQYVRSKTLLQRFIREQPHWYRKLSRNPHDLQALELTALHYYQQTLPHKVEKFTSSLEMASLMFHMFQEMRQSD